MEKSLQNRDRVGVPDSVLLEDYQNEDVFVKNLQKRFKENLIYTYIGPVLVSVNPYKEIDIYGPSCIKEYENKHFFEAAPHVFAITDKAYMSLREENREQCILISGESGSGKTEASKKVLHYIAAVTEQRGAIEQVKNKLLQCNPLLEAFGNAVTNKNDNSSRFGKYMDVQFNFQGLPVGGNILNYLLEKSRVIVQATGERNFHIFYQLLEGASDDQLKELFLKRNPSSYYYLSYGNNSKKNTFNDQTAFEEVKNALKTLEFSATEQQNIFAIVAAILHLGNIGFSENDGKSHIIKRDPLELVSKLIKCNKEALAEALTHRTISAHGDILTSPLNRELSVYARDALAKAVYDRLFSWLVNRINNSLQSEDARGHVAIGILDIYGFEIFQKNSFEQLCINFCNEKLQQLFIELTLKSEQEEYLKEGIEWKHVDYFDNQIICDLIEEKHKGIIAVMDEECLRPGDATDFTLLEKMNRNFANHKHYISHAKADVKTQKRMGRDEFCLMHYAGDVTYNINSFLEKNNDLLYRDLKEVMSNAGNEIINTIFTAKEQTSKKRPETAITQFKTSLNNLIVILMDKEPSYIRCIKPNDSKRAGIFDVQLVKHQVKYLGLMENLRVRRAGFAYRRSYEKFLHRYKFLCKETWPNYNGNARDGVQLLLTSLGCQPHEYVMGRTKIFIKNPRTLFDIEDLFQAKRHEIAAIIQSSWKGLVQRRKYETIKHSALVIQKWVRRYLAQKLAEKRRNAALTITKLIRGYLTRNGPPTEDNKSFIQLAKAQWLLRLAKALPRSLLDRSWPQCPYSCRESSALLQKYHRLHLCRLYQQRLTAEEKNQFELKILAETLFKNKKKSYLASVPIKFKSERIAEDTAMLKKSFDNFLPKGEREVYFSNVMKYDRHGYKSRERIFVVTSAAIYLLEKNKGVKQKHRFPIEKISLIVTAEKDKMLMIRLPDDLIKKDKGDLILEVPFLIEAVTFIIDITRNFGQLTIIDQNTIEHHMKQGKHGVIEITVGNAESIHKNKSGHLLIVASP